jgi:hypothetical protein
VSTVESDDLRFRVEGAEGVSVVAGLDVLGAIFEMIMSCTKEKIR